MPHYREPMCFLHTLSFPMETNYYWMKKTTTVDQLMFTAVDVCVLANRSISVGIKVHKRT